MLYDIPSLWVWLALAALLGGAMGWRHETSGPQGPWFHGWVRGALIALAVAFFIALIGLFPGRMGFWLESAVLFCVVYALGGLAGGALRRYREAM